MTKKREAELQDLKVDWKRRYIEAIVTDTEPCVEYRQDQWFGRDKKEFQGVIPGWLLVRLIKAAENRPVKNRLAVKQAVLNFITLGICGESGVGV